MGRDCPRVLCDADPGPRRSGVHTEYRKWTDDVLDSGSSNQLNHYVRELSDGVYTLRFINDGAGPVAISWLLNVASLDWEKIIGNGVGQSSALA